MLHPNWLEEAGQLQQSLWAANTVMVGFTAELHESLLCLVQTL